MNVAMLDLSAQHAPIRSQILAALEEVVDSNAFVLGPRVGRFEERVAAYCGVEHAIGVSSGTDALLASLMALEIGPGDEVITTPYSFFATAGCIARVGAKPVFVDIDPVTCNIDPQAIEPAVTPQTRAIIPVHLYGQCADMEPILAVAREHGLPVIEDAAQAIGARDRHGRPAGSMGTAACLSFFPAKNLGGPGDGGMVLTNDPELNRKLRLLRVHGAEPKYHHEIIGGNFRLDTLHAAVLDVKLDHLDAWTERRRSNAERYRDLFAAAGLADGSVELPRSIHEEQEGRGRHVYNQFVIHTCRRDGLRQHLKDAGVATAVYYPTPLHLQPCFRYLGYGEGDLPYAERASRETLAIPVHSELTEHEQDYTVGRICEFLETTSSPPDARSSGEIRTNATGRQRTRRGAA